MTLTPDRTPDRRSGSSRGARSSVNGRAASGAGPRPKTSRPGEADAKPAGTAAPRTLREQLEAAGMDLTGHQLADQLDAIASVAPPDFTAPEAPVGDGSDRSATEQAPSSERASHGRRSPRGNGSSSAARAEQDAASSRPSVSDMESPFQTAAEEGRDTSLPDSPHPMLSKEQWADLKAIVPEVTDSIDSLTALSAELKDFQRPMGPEEAVNVMQGVEALSRIVDFLSAVTVSVFERTGTPKDYGAKTTKALVQNKLKLSGREAHRRTELAKNLGKRVDISGQSRPPKYPVVADGLQSGRLSASQASVIGECLDGLPSWVTAEVATKVESSLVSRATDVRVSDIKRIFTEMLDRLDPDGAEPKDSHDRSQYRVNVRQRRDGDWDLSGLLDPIAGGILQGWLTSRIKADDPDASGDQLGANGGGAFDLFGSGAPQSAAQVAQSVSPSVDDQQMFDLFNSVLSGDVHDARVPADPYPSGLAEAVHGGTAGQAAGSLADAGPLAGAGSLDDSESAAVPSRGWGVREDGSLVDTSDAQGSVKNLIYERFATMISRIEMDRVGKGAAFALVVTATAEEAATKKGRARTGTEAEFPIDLAVDEGLNGSVFFHLMTDRAKSVALATEQRHATKKQLAILASRDQGCTFPGCETPPGWCDAHHIVPWAVGGRTDLNNLTLACGLHHHLIDKSDWYAISLFDGQVAWVPPASIDPERRPILHARFIAREAAATLFDEIQSMSAPPPVGRHATASPPAQGNPPPQWSGPPEWAVGEDDDTGEGSDSDG